jgi:hypothetical protein
MTAGNLVKSTISGQNSQVQQNGKNNNCEILDSSESLKFVILRESMNFSKP